MRDASSLRYRLISFDLDGTLIDTAAEIAEAANLALEDHGMARWPVEQITLLIGRGMHELMTKLLAQVRTESNAGVEGPATDAVIASFEHHYAATTGSSARPYPPCLAALQSLQRAGIRLACVTNKESRHAHRVLQATGLDGFFERVIGGDTLPQKKPHASVLTDLVQGAGLAVDRVAHVGDSIVDVQAARNAGVAAWAVRHGYNAGQPIEDTKPDIVFEDLGEVARHVLAIPRTSAETSAG